MRACVLGWGDLLVARDSKLFRDKTARGRFTDTLFDGEIWMEIGFLCVTLDVLKFTL